MLKNYFNKEKIEAGCDEAGRGCLAGPVVAAAVILPSDCYIEELNDSKQLTEKQRERLFPIIKETALAYGIAEVSPAEIDKINILNASFLAMHKAIDQLKTKPELLLIDGNRFKAYPNIEHQCLIKGDANYLSIAAASVLAKVTRDHIMEDLHQEFPDFNWKKNKGYPTKFHREMLKEMGATAHHRLSFRLLDNQGTLF
ncbi:MAG: ribonuclease HII [Brumimicrobium sp.]|nr:ribonuclease HII [Brumimicrobium sp.]MCO5267841.1 ribonuclease HII [Brumimicrobium sp.]